MTSISSKIFWKTPGNDNVGNKKVTGTEKYEIIKEIGQGSYGIVYKARNRITKELCAIKKISLGKCKLDKAQEEADKLKNLEKIGIPDTILKYYDAYIDESNFYIVTEFCENGDLNDVIHKNLHISLDEKMIWNYFLEICIALYFLHKNRILHRDIKPLNVYLVPGNHIKLGDFGLAKTLKDTDYTTTFVGTPLYVCPEIIRHLQYNNKADIWSLGVMLYEMVTKTWPFMSYDQYEILTKILKESYKPLPESVSLEIKDLVNRCLQKDPSKRPPIQEILIMPNVRKWAKELKIKNFPSLDSLVDELAKNRALPLEYQHLLKPKINPIKGEEEKKKDSDFEEFDFEYRDLHIGTYHTQEEILKIYDKIAELSKERQKYIKQCNEEKDTKTLKTYYGIIENVPPEMEIPPIENQRLATMVKLHYDIYKLWKDVNKQK